MFLMEEIFAYLDVEGNTRCYRSWQDGMHKYGYSEHLFGPELLDHLPLLMADIMGINKEVEGCLAKLTIAKALSLC